MRFFETKILDFFQSKRAMQAKLNMPFYGITKAHNVFKGRSYAIPRYANKSF
jgi:hypothetical protein